MRIPVWLTFGIAILVIAFGIYRLRMGFRADPDDQGVPRRGFAAMSRNKHRLVGVIYLLLGTALFATALGWNPLGTMFAPDTETPKGTEPAKVQLPEDGLKK